MAKIVLKLFDKKSKIREYRGNLTKIDQEILAKNLKNKLSISTREAQNVASKSHI